LSAWLCCHMNRNFHDFSNTVCGWAALGARSAMGLNTVSDSFLLKTISM